MNHTTSPHQARPAATPDGSANWKRPVARLGWLPVWSATVIVGAVYVAWLAAFAQLGRPPVPSMDDPKLIGGFSTEVTTAMGWLIVVSLAGWAVGMASSVAGSLLLRGEARSACLRQAAIGLATVALLLLFVRFAPGGAGRWIID